MSKLFEIDDYQAAPDEVKQELHAWIEAVGYSPNDIFAIDLEPDPATTPDMDGDTVVLHRYVRDGEGKIVVEDGEPERDYNVPVSGDMTQFPILDDYFDNFCDA